MGDTGVGVSGGGTGVFVGSTGVGVGSAGVSVGGTGVSVAGPGVTVGHGVAVGHSYAPTGGNGSDAIANKATVNKMAILRKHIANPSATSR